MKMTNKTQAGRSMVEILGVIAIIGVLAAGGVGGLNWAMNKYRAYRIVSGAQHKVMLANVRRKAGQGVNRYKDQIEEGIMAYGVSYDSDYTDAALSVSGGKKIVVDKISRRVCEILLEDAGLVAIRDLESAKVLINGTLLENNPACQDGEEANALTLVLNSNTRSMRELPEVGRCVFQGQSYDSGSTVGECGKCIDGVIQVDPTKVNDCKTCKTNTWTLEVKSNGTHPIAEGSEKDKCCVGGVLKYDAVLCPRGCVVGGNTYNDGDDIGVCKQCSNGSVVAKSGYTVPSCKVCNADGSVTTDSTCCSTGIGGSWYPNGADIDVCRTCVNGSPVDKPNECCHVNHGTYISQMINGAAIGECRQCVNGSVVLKSGYTVPNCKICNADGTLSDDPTCCTVGATKYTNGAAVNQCGKCENGTIVTDNTKVPLCKTCNTSTWKLANAANNTAAGECGKCSSGNIVADSTKYNANCQTCSTTDGSIINKADGTAVKQCGKCVNGAVVKDASKETPCKTCNTSTWNLSNVANNTVVGACAKCSSGSVVADSTKYNTNCQTCSTTDGSITNKADGTAVNQCGKCASGAVVKDASKETPCKKCNTSTWNLTNVTNNTAVGACAKCSSGKIVADSTKYNTYCQTCSTTDGSITNKADGTAVGTCKECKSGAAVAKTGYTIPKCKVCNADGTLGNAADGSSQSGGKCCLGGSFTTCCPSGTTWDSSKNKCLGPATMSCTLSDCDLGSDRSKTMACNIPAYTSSYTVKITSSGRLEFGGGASFGPASMACVFSNGTREQFWSIPKGTYYNTGGWMYLNHTCTMPANVGFSGLYIYSNYGCSNYRKNIELTFTRND